MKALLFVAFLLLAGPAQALDYVKCEAIQSAGSRLQASYRAEVRTLIDGFKEQRCGPAERTIAYLVCAKEALNDPLLAKQVKRPDEIYPARIQRVEADYKKAGCY